MNFFGSGKDDKKEESKWVDVGEAAKKAYEDGKVSPGEIGSVALKAASAYKTEGDKFNPRDAGVNVVGGFMGLGNKNTSGNAGKQDEQGSSVRKMTGLLGPVDVANVCSRY